MNKFIKYIGKVDAKDMAMCSSLGVTKIENQILRTEQGELFVIKDYVVEDGADTYVVSKKAVWIKDSGKTGEVKYKQKPLGCQEDCIKHMLSHKLGVNRTIRIRTRGPNVRQTYYTRINTYIDANGEISHGFH